MTSAVYNDINNEVQTTNATPTSVYTFIGTPDNSVVTVSARVIGRSAGGIVGSWVLSITGKRGTGNMSVIGTLINVISAQKELAALLWDATIVASGNNFVVQVTGAAGVTIDWLVVMDVVAFTP